MHWVVLPEDLGALGYAANRQHLVVERIPLQRERLVELDRLQAPEPEEPLELARRAVDERRADVIAPDTFVRARVLREHVLAAVGIGEENTRHLRNKMIAPEGFAASPLVLGHLELSPSSTVARNVFAVSTTSRSAFRVTSSRARTAKR